MCEAGKYASAQGMSICAQCMPGKALRERIKQICVFQELIKTILARHSVLSAPMALQAMWMADHHFVQSVKQVLILVDNIYSYLLVVGYFASGQGAVGCSICPSGRYSFAGSTACLFCANGTASSSPGRGSLCDPCNAGSFANGTGLTQCRNCAPGKMRF
jgi:hypothetical protein